MVTILFFFLSRNKLLFTWIPPQFSPLLPFRWTGNRPPSTKSPVTFAYRTRVFSIFGSMDRINSNKLVINTAWTTIPIGIIDRENFFSAPNFISTWRSCTRSIQLGCDRQSVLDSKGRNDEAPFYSGHLSPLGEGVARSQCSARRTRETELPEKRKSIVKTAICEKR